jgi:hypothetical protein
MQHPDFQTGQFNTGFIAKYFPDGFHGAKVTESSHDLFCALSLVIHINFYLVQEIFLVN